MRGMGGDADSGALYARRHVKRRVLQCGDLPADKDARDALLLRIIGSPDPYQKQIDGLGGTSSSTSKIVVLSVSSRADCDIDYLFGAVAIDAPLIDWSGNCGNLSAAVATAAIRLGLLSVPPDTAGGILSVPIW